MDLIKLGKKLFKIHRSITGKGVVKTLRILKRECSNLKIKNIKSGTKVYDWKIPSEWNIKDAYVINSKGTKIIDFKRNNLHVVAYSQPIKRYVSKKELLDHLHFYKKQKNLIPYVTSFYKKYWGFCISYKDFSKIKKSYNDNDKFFVNIDSKFNKNGKLNYGELFIKGKSQKEILISTNICHPSMANNELSGPLVSIALAKYFKKNQKKLKRSIRFVFLPETIGAIGFINRNLKKMRKNIFGGYVLSCIGDEREYSYLFSKYGNSLSDRAALKAFKKLKIKFKKYNFLKSESDERRYNSPHVNLEIGSIMRSKYHSYPEYHTSADNFDLVTKKGLEGSIKLVKLAIKNLQNLKITKNETKNLQKTKKLYPIASNICDPNLGKRNLYPMISEKNNNFKDPHTILDFLIYADGTNTLAEIKKIIKCSNIKVNYIYKLLKNKKLIKINNI